MGQYTMIVTVALFVTTLGFIAGAGGNTIFDYQGTNGEFEEPPEVSGDNLVDTVTSGLDYAGWIFNQLLAGGSGYEAFNIIIGGSLAILAGFIIIAIIRGLG